jgi:hypothetical protein
VSLKERIEKLKADSDVASKDLNKAEVMSNLLGIQAELEKPETTIALDVFETMDQDMRLMCLQGLVFINATALNKS